MWKYNRSVTTVALLTFFLFIELISFAFPPDPVADGQTSEVERCGTPGALTVGVAIRNRAKNLLKVLPSLLQMGDVVGEILILDYGSDQQFTLNRRIARLARQHSVSIRVDRVNADRWHPTHASNLLISRTHTPLFARFDAEYVVRQPALGCQLTVLLSNHSSGAFVTGERTHEAGDSGDENDDSLNGFLAARVSDLRAVGGYNEYLFTYGYDDTCLIEALEEHGLKKVPAPDGFLRVLEPEEAGPDDHGGGMSTFTEWQKKWMRIFMIMRNQAICHHEHLPWRRPLPATFSSQSLWTVPNDILLQVNLATQRQVLGWSSSLNCWINGHCRVPSTNLAEPPPDALIERLWGALFPKGKDKESNIASSILPAVLGIQVFHSEKENRTIDFADCLGRNMRLGVFERIVVLVDTASGAGWPSPIWQAVFEAWGANFHKSRPQQELKPNVVPERTALSVYFVSERPSINTFLQYLYPASDRLVKVIANNDIYFDETAVPWIKHHLNMPYTISALTRRDHSHPDNPPLLLDPLGWFFDSDKDMEAKMTSQGHSWLPKKIPNIYSSDVWAARRWPKSLDLDTVFPGNFFADTLFHGIIHQMGLHLINPCVDVRIFHLQSTTSISDEVASSEKSILIRDISKVHGEAWVAATSYWSTLSDITSLDIPSDFEHHSNGQSFLTTKAALKSFFGQENWASSPKGEQLKYVSVYVFNSTWSEIIAMRSKFCRVNGGCFLYPNFV